MYYRVCRLTFVTSVLTEREQMVASVVSDEDRLYDCQNVLPSRFVQVMNYCSKKILLSPELF